MHYSQEESLIMNNTTHTGQIRGLDFNRFQSNLLASAGSNNEIYIWDLTKPDTPYSPGAKSSKLEDITSVGWNGQVQHILATSSSTGHTVVWDLRNRREVMTLSAPISGGINAGHRSISSVVWHPDNVSNKRNRGLIAWILKEMYLITIIDHSIGNSL
jgi:protein transport protein SEC31